MHLTIFRFLIIKANKYVAIKKEGASLVAQTVKNLTAMQEIQVQSLGWEDPLEKWIFQYSCLENSMDRGDWQAKVRGVTESDTTELLTLTFHAG